jgi:UDP-N-acetylglucosamine/UDP-N-acetylgalactosamine diphosphorylase
MAVDAAELKRTAGKYGQEHLFAFYDSLPADGQKKLLAQIAAVEFDTVDRLVKEFIKQPAKELGGKLEPAAVVACPKNDADLAAHKEARDMGEEALRKGRVACFVVAGGQGTRLGLNGPKGAFEIGPISKRSLFQVHTEKVKALRKKYKAAIPFLIMTSDANDDETRAYFEANKYFGLSPDTVRIFKQANMPAVGKDGKILLAAKDEIALSPNGHGGSIKALWESGAIEWVRSQGVDTLFYFQVDNPLTKICDPVFIGHHLKARSQMSTKVCRKRDWKEKVGVLGLRDGKMSVIEYSDLPEALAKEVDANGALKWWAGNIAIHILDCGFIEQLNKGGFQLPYHKAEKAVPCIGADGNPVQLKAGEKNGVKFETFVFDALAQAERTLNLETLREEDFSPVKNAEGDDSPATTKRDMQAQYARWLEAAGVKLPRKADGSLDCVLEISPLTSVDGENLERATPKTIASGAIVKI